ncbi:MAG: serine/threonine-protein phosphatase [Deltaproteobacteria bacterium]|nr:MAG: serine/threonine-protein phosphatase [Deltaproteobacteria bacterium]
MSDTREYSDTRQYIKVNAGDVSAVGISDVGKKRTRNEDAFWIDESGRIILLADGMGGHDNGAEASRSAIEIFSELLNLKKIEEEMFDGTAMMDVPPELSKLFPVVDRAVEKTAGLLWERNNELRLDLPMGTTIVGLVIAGTNHVLWFHVGDSRIYRWRESRLDRLTRDHSPHQEWLDSGRQGAEPGRHLLTRALGIGPMIFADINWDRRRKGDLFILCSDGLTDMISDAAVERILRSENDVERIANSLVEAAMEAGGHDNVSVVVCRV